MKILIIGSGGREHALGWKLKQSPEANKIYFAPGNPGTKQLGENVNIDVNKIKKLLNFAKKNKIDLTVVGPELPLTLGIVDAFKKSKLKIIGPTKKASQIESSKIFAKNLMKKYKIPTAEFNTFKNKSSAEKYLPKTNFPIVLKADGLYAGKGVAVCKNLPEAKLFLRQLKEGKIIIEEFLTGPEVSFMVITDGKNFLSFSPSQDHKRLLDNDAGPNTGGMGAYTPVPFIGKKMIKRIEREIVTPTIKAMAKEGSPYQGILYPGLMLTKDGPKVLEFNCRFGDPETQPLMMNLKSDLLEIFLAQQKKKLKNKKIVFKTGASVCIVLASAGYPKDYKKDEEIFGLDKIKNKDLQVFHSGTKELNKKIVTNGGRVLAVTAYGKNLQDAVRRSYRAIGKKGIHFKGMQFRADIAKKGLKFSKKYD